MTDEKKFKFLGRIEDLAPAVFKAEGRAVTVEELFDHLVETQRLLQLAERVVEAARILKNLAEESASILSLDSEVDELCDAVRAYDAERGRWI